MSKPLTRKEQYYANIAGEGVEIPAKPITREEAYLEKIAQGGGVVANPEGTPAGTLESVKIGDVVYEVPQGGGSGTTNYNLLNNRPSINGNELIGDKSASDLGLFDGDYAHLTNRPSIPAAQVNSDWNATSGVAEILNKPSIPSTLSQLTDDAGHRTVSDTEKSAWNAKSNFSGSYNDLSDKPTIPDAQIQSDWNQTDNTKPDYIKNKPASTSQEQADWSQSDNTKVDYIKNKPTLGTAAAKNVAASGDAGLTEVVMGDDSRLTDSRPASDVSSWAKQATKPTYTASEVGAIPSTDKGANGGVATLGNDGIVPSSQLPTMFDGDYNSLTNRPTLGTAAAKDVPSAGNASLTEVVMGSDSRLSDDRNAKDVYPWAKAATKPTYTATEVGAIPSTDKGANGGVAELDSNGKVPSSQLPSYVDDVLSYVSQSAFPATGETGKIYIAEDTNKTYRWSGSAYAEISESLALGETSSTAYRGDRGKVAYDHSQTTGNPHGTTASDVGLGNVPNVATDDQTPTFTTAQSRNNLVSGEKLSVMLGRISKFFNDLKTVAFTGNYKDLTDKPQVDTMPTASADYLGDVVQYVGATTVSYTHGYYYECVNNGGVYSWVQTDVQPSSGSGKIDTDAGTFEDAEHNTYTGVTTDMISYDATNNQLLLKVGGADSVIPFSRGSELVDINPDKAYTGSYYYVYTVSGSAGSSIPVQGYDKIYLRTGSNRTASYSLLDKNMQSISSGTFSNSSWLELSIPKNALLIFIQCTNATGSGATIFYSLLA